MNDTILIIYIGLILNLMITFAIMYVTNKQHKETKSKIDVLNKYVSREILDIHAKVSALEIRIQELEKRIDSKESDECRCDLCDCGEDNDIARELRALNDTLSTLVEGAYLEVDNGVKAVTGGTEALKRAFAGQNCDVNDWQEEIKFDRYRNYVGTANFSEEDNCWHGKIEYISDLVTYEADSEEELENEFHSAVDDYIQFKNEDKGPTIMHSSCHMCTESYEWQFEDGVTHYPMIGKEYMVIGELRDVEGVSSGVALWNGYLWKGEEGRIFDRVYACCPMPDPSDVMSKALEIALKEKM